MYIMRGKGSDILDPWALLNDILRDTLNILGENLYGFYAHGSLAFRSFDPRHSDIDFLIVVNTEPDERQKMDIIRVLLDKTPLAPPKGLEMSVVRARDCQCPAHPIPYYLHFSNMHIQRAREDLRKYAASMKGVDPDLAAHFAVTREVGAALWGPPANRAFGRVRREDIIASILADVGGAAEDIVNDGVYCALNLCRALLYVEQGKLLSKEGGGEWALTRLESEHSLFARRALKARKRREEFKPDAIQARAFAEYMLRAIFAKI